ncbi:MAG: hypothetical protein LBF59_08475 [Prevotellaceae bacterium]|jgi:hypothetical protein|nr:hypothetical protein [Prevotellaceae bacterium]
MSKKNSIGKKQAYLFSLIKAQIPKNIGFIYQLEEVLNIGTTALYQRIKGETELKLSELCILCSEYNISMDKIMNYHSGQDSELAVAKRSGCFIPTYIRNEIPTSKQQNRNEEALKLARQILDKEIKIFSPATLQAIKNDTRQVIENRQSEKNVPAPESRTNLKTPTTGQQIPWRDKFSDTVPKTFAPPELINMAHLSLFPTSQASHIAG